MSLRGQKSLGAPPPRRRGSVRRTTSLQAFFPEGPRGPIHFTARGRDLYTGSVADEPRILAREHAEIIVSPERQLIALAVEGRNPTTLESLIGKRVGGELRDAVARELPADRAAATLLNRLLEDLGGGVFMSQGAWMAWLSSADADADADAVTDNDERLRRNAEGLCLSFSPGSPSLRADGSVNEPIADHPVVPLPLDARDPIGWHEFAPLDGPNQWRIRYSDLWAEDGGLRLVAGFQDSGALPDRTHERYAFHEYRVFASIALDLTVQDIRVDPGVLPYRTCLAAPSTAQQLVGRDVASFREVVPTLLSGTAGCTHLNEQLRVMPDVAALAEALTCEGAVPSTQGAHAS